MGTENINRGKKWSEVRAKAVFENMVKDVKWLDSQEDIVKDIKEYEDSLTPQTKSKEKK